MQGRGRQAGQARLVDGIAERVVVGVHRLHHRLLQPGRGLPGGGGQRDPRRPPGGALVLLGDQCEQTGHRGGLAGAGAAGDDRGPRGRRCPRGVALLGEALAGEDPLQAPLQGGEVDVGRVAAVGAHPGDEVVADLALLAPVAVEVEPAPDQAQHLLAHQRARGHLLAPRASTSGHGRGASSSLGSSETVARSTHTEPWRTARTASAAASSTCSSSSPSSRPRRSATWTSAAASRSGRLKVASRPVAPSARRRSKGSVQTGAGPAVSSVMAQPPVVRRGARRARPPAPPAGRQLNTPHGTLPSGVSTSGVSGPHMPRT